MLAVMGQHQGATLDLQISIRGDQDKLLSVISRNFGKFGLDLTWYCSYLECW